MEVLIVIGVIWFILAAIQGNKKKKQEEAYEELLRQIAEERRKNAFKVKVESSTVEGDEFDWDVFAVKMKGIIDGPHDNFKAKNIVTIMDVTDGEQPVFSLLEEYQRPDSRIFWFESDVFTLPYQDTIINDWTIASNVPKLFLEFPRTGQRKLKFTVFVVNANTDTILAEESVKITYTNTDKGYLDKIEDRERFEEMVIQSAMLVSASDGDVDEAEANVVKQWVKRRLSGYKDEYKDEEKSRLNGYIKKASDALSVNRLTLSSILRDVEDIASEGEKYELLEVCLDVARADGKADPSELKIVNEIAEYMSLDQKKYRAMIQKSLPVTMHTTGGYDESMLGIKPGMANKEVKQILRKEYQKWNARVASSDPEVREQAQKMIDFIAKTREKYT